MVCGVTGFPPPHSINWTIAWEGQQPQHHHQLLTSRGLGHRVSLAYNLNMSAYNSSSQVEIICSACNALGCGRSNTLTLFIVGK